jgi:hypothetical protein
MLRESRRALAAASGDPAMRSHWSMSPDGGPAQPGDEHRFREAELIPPMPPELGEAIAVAAHACDRLERGGRRVRFALDPCNGQLQIHVLGLGEQVLDELTAGQVLAVAETGVLC